jgi:hypothetical protein
MCGLHPIPDQMASSHARCGRNVQLMLLFGPSLFLIEGIRVFCDRLPGFCLRSDCKAKNEQSHDYGR